MKYVHNVLIRVFSKEESFEEIEKGFDYILPFDLMKEKVKINAQYYGSDSENQGVDSITIYSVFLDRQSLIGPFLNHLRALLSPDQKKKIIFDAEKFMDEECSIFIRLNKDELKSEKVELTESGNCYHITMNIASYPKKKEVSLKIVRDLFS